MTPPPPHLPKASRAVWLKNLHQWHWISSALCLLGMLMFSVTGITLNHAGQIEAKPTVVNRKATLPAPLQAQLRAFAAAHAADHGDARAPLPAPLADWARASFAIEVGGIEAEWTEEDAYVPLPRPGGDAWLRLGADGAAEYEKTDRGWISWLNDLHKGRNTGKAWGWFIDVFAGACVVFAVTGLILLQFHARARPLTWPLVAGGLVIPLLLVILFVHL